MIVGCGAVGRPLALTLASMGVRNFVLIDHDKVSGINLGTQGWRPGQIEHPKVVALGSDLHMQNTEVHLNVLPCRWDTNLHHRLTVARAIGEPSELTHKFPSIKRWVWCLCVDSIDTRRAIGEALYREEAIPPLAMMDARMNMDAVVTYYVGSREIYNTWTRTLFAASDGVAGRCTARSTLYAAQLAASRMARNFVTAMRRIADPTIDNPVFEVHDDMSLPMCNTMSVAQFERAAVPNVTADEGATPSQMGQSFQRQSVAEASITEEPATTHV